MSAARRARFGLLALLAAGAAAGPRHAAPPGYRASGGPPSWDLHVDREKIVLRIDEPDRPFTFRVHTYRSYRYRRADGMRRWKAGIGHEGIVIRSLRGPCEETERGRDRVLINVRGLQLKGCGGPWLEED